MFPKKVSSRVLTASRLLLTTGDRVRWGNNELRRPRNKHFLVSISQNRTSVAPLSFHLVWLSCQPDCLGLAEELQLVKATAAACGTERKQRPHPLEGQHWDMLVVNSSGMSQLRGRKKIKFALETFAFWSASCPRCRLLAISQASLLQTLVSFFDPLPLSLNTTTPKK